MTCLCQQINVICRFWKDDNARFTTIPFKSYLIHNVEDIVAFPDLKLFNFDNISILSCSRNGQVTLHENHNWKFSQFKTHWYQFILDKTKLLRIPLCHLCMKSHFKCRLQSLYYDAEMVYLVFLFMRR